MAATEGERSKKGPPPKRSQKQATLPTDLALEIEAIVVEANPWLGYPSLSAFATEACRRHLREIMQAIHQHQITKDGNFVPPAQPKKKPE